MQAPEYSIHLLYKALLDSLHKSSVYNPVTALATVYYNSLLASLLPWAPTSRRRCSGRSWLIEFFRHFLAVLIYKVFPGPSHATAYQNQCLLNMSKKVRYQLHNTKFKVWTLHCQNMTKDFCFSSNCYKKKKKMVSSYPLKFKKE